LPRFDNASAKPTVRGAALAGATRGAAADGLAGCAWTPPIQPASTQHSASERAMGNEGKAHVRLARMGRVARETETGVTVVYRVR
jgi:hypothetical protein